MRCSDTVTGHLATNAPLPWPRAAIRIACIVALTMLAAGCKQEPKLIAATSINGQVVKVFAAGNGSQSANVMQTNDITQVKVGPHLIRIRSDGRVSIDGRETSYGPFTELDVTIGDSDAVEIKATN